MNEKYEYTNQVLIRSDNRRHFITKNVCIYLGLIRVNYEFTHITTPQENALIEVYHGILQKELSLRFGYYLVDQYDNYYSDMSNLTIIVGFTDYWGVLQQWKLECRETSNYKDNFNRII